MPKGIGYGKKKPIKKSTGKMAEMKKPALMKNEMRKKNGTKKK